MSHRTERFDEILLKYKFVEPASDELKSHIGDIKRAQFKKILKKTAGYSLVFSIIAYVFFTLKKLGISVTIAKSAVILTVGVTAAAVTTTAGSYYTCKYIKEHRKEEIKRIEEKTLPVEQNIEGSIIDKKAKPQEADSLEAIKKRISVYSFNAENISSDLAREVTQKLSNEISSLIGKENVVNSANSNKRAGIMLKGSVEFLDGKYTINAKIVDVENLKLLFYTKETISNTSGIDSACKNIAKKIYESKNIPSIPVKE